MTPLHIEIALHYHVSPAEFPRVNAPAVMDVLREFVDAGLLNHSSGERDYEPTPGLAVYIEALLRVPLPVQQWAIPKSFVRQRLARAASLSPERRTEIASTAAKKRWAKP